MMNEQASTNAAYAKSRDVIGDSQTPQSIRLFEGESVAVSDV